MALVIAIAQIRLGALILVARICVAAAMIPSLRINANLHIGESNPERIQISSPVQYDPRRNETCPAPSADNLRSRDSPARAHRTSPRNVNTTDTGFNRVPSCLRVTLRTY